MPVIKISSPNLKRQLNNLNAFQLAIGKEIGEGTKENARKILDLSDKVKPKVPVKNGDLRATGRIAKVTVTGVRSAWAVLYGGLSPSGKVVDYAELVHDDVRFRKNWTRPGSGPKFVSDHIERQDKAMAVAFMEAMDKAAKTTIGP